MHECASQTPNMLLKKQIFSTRIEKIRRHCQYISHSILVESFYLLRLHTVKFYRIKQGSFLYRRSTAYSVVVSVLVAIDELTEKFINLRPT